jgi:hypothetical protein
VRRRRPAARKEPTSLRWSGRVMSLPIGTPWGFGGGTSTRSRTNRPTTLRSAGVAAAATRSLTGIEVGCGGLRAAAFLATAFLIPAGRGPHGLVLTGGAGARRRDRGCRRGGPGRSRRGPVRRGRRGGHGRRRPPDGSAPAGGRRSGGGRCRTGCGGRSGRRGVRRARCPRTCAVAPAGPAGGRRAGCVSGSGGNTGRRCLVACRSAPEGNRSVVSTCVVRGPIGGPAPHLGSRIIPGRVEFGSVGSGAPAGRFLLQRRHADPGAHDGCHGDEEEGHRCAAVVHRVRFVPGAAGPDPDPAASFAAPHAAW